MQVVKGRFRTFPVHIMRMRVLSEISRTHPALYMILHGTITSSYYFLLQAHPSPIARSETSEWQLSFCPQVFNKTEAR